jgi:hypothetical protein
MPRRTRLALLVAATLIVAVTGTVLATRAPAGPSSGQTTADDTEPSPDASAIDHAADRLSANGIELEEGLLDELAGQYGVGGAVRIAAWAAADDGDDITVDSIRAMRDGDGSPGSGMGWGQIARELGVRPGIGSIMGNGGNGNGNGKGNGNGGAPVQPDASP